MNNYESSYSPQLTPRLQGIYLSIPVSVTTQSTVTLNFSGTPLGATDYTGYAAVIRGQAHLISSNTSSSIVTDVAFDNVVEGYDYELGLYEKSYTAYRPNMGQPPNGMKPAHFCTICSHAYREEEMIYFEGKWYCYKNDCYKVAGNIKYNRRAKAYRPQSRGEPSSVPFIVRTID